MLDPHRIGATAVARILIVDDSNIDRRLIRGILQRAGYETVEAMDGEEALRLYLDDAFDIVVTDLEMPDVHGFELISILTEFTEPPAIIAVSGLGPLQLHMAGSLGATWTLQKPVNPTLLVDAVRRAEHRAEESRRSG
jgi:CheY-like chemotaxis protein